MSYSQNDSRDYSSFGNRYGDQDHHRNMYRGRGRGRGRDRDRGGDGGRGRGRNQNRDNYFEERRSQRTYGQNVSKFKTNDNFSTTEYPTFPQYINENEIQNYVKNKVAYVGTFKLCENYPSIAYVNTQEFPQISIQINGHFNQSNHPFLLFAL